MSDKRSSCSKVIPLLLSKYPTTLLKSRIPEMKKQIILDLIRGSDYELISAYDAPDRMKKLCRRRIKG